MAAIPKGAVPAYTDALAIAPQHLPRRPELDGESFTKSSYTRGLHKSERGSAAGPGGDRVDYLLQAAWDRDGGILDQLYEFHNHVANGATPEPIGKFPDQVAQDEFCWWLVIYLLPRWLLSELADGEIADDAYLGASRPVRLRCKKFFNCEWRALHAMSAATTGGAPRGPTADDNQEDITPEERRAARCEFLANLDEYGRAARALVGTSGVLSESLCSSLGDGGAHLWDLCTQRVQMLHPNPDPQDGLNAHWTPAHVDTNALDATQVDVTFTDQHGTVDVEWNDRQVATAVHNDAHALGIMHGDRLLSIDGVPLDPSSDLAANLREKLDEVDHRPLTLTLERSNRPRPQLGGLPPELVNVHFAGKLVLLHKGTDDEFRQLLENPGTATIDQVAIRPIAIGGSHDRCICRCQQATHGKSLATYFEPLQYSVAVSGGLDMIIHAQRIHAHQHPEHAFISIDARNAFNTLHRAAIARGMVDGAGLDDMLSYFLAGHAAPVPLYCPGTNTPIVWSSDGARQGCPLGSTYFCLGLHPLLLEMRRLFPTVRVAAATDDIGIQGPVPDLERAWQWLTQEGPAYGYHVRPDKCVLLPPASGPHMDHAQLQLSFPGVSVGDTDGNNHTRLLGAPVGEDRDAAYRFVARMAYQATELCSALPTVNDPGVQFRLLRYCSVARARFLPRVTPYSTSEDELFLGISPIQQYAAHADQQHARALAHILCLQDDAAEEHDLSCYREQAALPPTKSGCGIPLVSAMAPGACLASLSHTLPLLLRHAEGQDIQGLHEHALVMVSHPDDPLGASAAHAKTKETYDWFIEAANQAALANIKVTSPPMRLPQTAIDTVTQQPNLRESDYAKLTTVKAFALLVSPSNGAVSNADRARILSCTGPCSHEWMSIGRRSWNSVPRMPGPAFQTALQFRLGTPLTVRRRDGGKCACNNATFCASHAAGCKANGWAYKRHEEIVSFFMQLAKAAGLAATRTNLTTTYPKIDTTGLPATAKARYIPDVIIRDFPDVGTHTVLDISITHPCGDRNQPWVHRAAADDRHTSKISRVQTHVQRAEEQFGQGSPDGHVFVPAVFESYGTPTKETLTLIHGLCDLHSHLHLHDNSDRAAATHYWIRRASNALQHANARQLHHLAADNPGPQDGMRQP